MISVVITPGGSPEALGALLGRLVPAAVDGLVRDVFLTGAADGLAAELCEEAGVSVVADLAAARATAKCAWLLVLPQDFRLPESWEPLAAAQVANGGGTIAEGRGGWLGLFRRRARLVRR
jgi:hypothetical protein